MAPCFFFVFILFVFFILRHLQESTLRQRGFDCSFFQCPSWQTFPELNFLSWYCQACLTVFLKWSLPEINGWKRTMRNWTKSGWVKQTLLKALRSVMCNMHPASHLGATPLESTLRWNRGRWRQQLSLCTPNFNDVDHLRQTNKWMTKNRKPTRNRNLQFCKTSITQP